jgi:hypothetical protein
MNLPIRSTRSSTLNWHAALAFGIGALLCFGCQRVQPTVPMTARNPDLTLELREVTLGKTIEFSYELTTPRAIQIRRGYLTEPTRRACTGGAAVDEFVYDDEVSSSPKLQPGLHRLAVRKWNAGRALLELDLVLDLEAADGTCVRVPAISRSLAFETPSRLTLVASLPLDFQVPQHGLRGHAGILGGVMTWAGPLALSAEGGIGAALCTAETCGKDSNGATNNGLAFPLVFRALSLHSLGSSPGFSHFGILGARYTYLPGEIPARAGTRQIGVHGAHLMLGYATGDGLPMLVLHPERGPLFGLEVPLGVWIDPDLSDHQVVFGSGVNFRFFFPI